MLKVKVGQEVYKLNIGNRARNTPQLLKTCVVTHVGRKYFKAREVQDNWGVTELQYYLESGMEKTDHSSGYKIYINKQDWEDEKEASKLIDVLKDIFSTFSRPDLTLKQLRDIVAIVSESKDNQ